MIDHVLQIPVATITGAKVFTLNFLLFFVVPLPSEQICHYFWKAKSCTWCEMQYFWWCASHGHCEGNFTLKTPHLNSSSLEYHCVSFMCTLPIWKFSGQGTWRNDQPLSWNCTLFVFCGFCMLPVLSDPIIYSWKNDINHSFYTCKFRSNEFKFNKNYDGGRPMLGFFTETTGRPIVQAHFLC